MRQVADPETRIQRSFQARSNRAQEKRKRQHIRQLSSLPTGFGQWDPAIQNNWLEQHDMEEFISE